jgi:phage N-6-adenine-methyltransferase
MYEFHELANAFPLIEGAEFDDLVADIRQYGQREPITLFEGKILDGRNRYRACLEAGLGDRVIVIDTDFSDYEAARAFVISANLRRRHLDESQRAMVAARLATMRQGERTDLAQIRARSQADAARELSVSRTSVQSASRVLNDGVPELVKAVDRGDVAVSTAAEIAKLPEDEQRERVNPGAYASLTGNDHWYTPEEFIERARRVMGGFDLDPASSEIAQRRVRAANFFTEADDGLAQEWHGRIWLNPPYSKGLIDKFIAKLVAEYESGRTTEAILLVNNSTETKWFRTAADSCTAVCFPDKRISFLTPAGEKAGSPALGNAFLYFGARPDAFAREFGFVWTPYTGLEDEAAADEAEAA